MPPKCLHCGLPTSKAARRSTLAHYLCEVCERILDAEEPVAEQRLREQLKVTASHLDLEVLISLHTYREDSPIRPLIHAAKYEGMMRLGRLLGARLKATLDTGAFDCIIPVPLHRTRRAERGYNQSDQLAAGIDRNKVVRNAVRRLRPTRTQTELHIDERLENVRGAFGLTRHATRLVGKRLLIVDDVMTTGATIASVAETLLDAHPSSLSIATVAIAEDPHTV